MKIAVIEDEECWRKYIKEAVFRYYKNDKHIEIDIFKDGESYLNSNENYDISLVDIEMPFMDGFETITKARERNQDGVFIILTTHTEMSRRGYIVNAFRYIDKANLTNEIDEALKSADIVLRRNEKLCINVIGAGEREILLKNIIYIETSMRCVNVHTKHDVYRCSDCLIDFENKLVDKWFFRSHNTYIVNLDEVKEFDEKKATMSNGHKIDIAHRKFYNFRRAYMNRRFECANG